MSASLKHKIRNFLHSLALIAGMAAIAWATTAAIWGWEVGLWVLGGIGAALALSPAFPGDLILSLYRAREIDPRAFPEGYELVATLARRAELPATPRLYYLPSALPNAFAVGGGAGAAVAVSDGLLRLLNGRELAGVLAHEISHIAHRDLWLLGLADVMGRLTTLSSYVGLAIVIVNLPLMLMGAVYVPWMAAVLLVLSPTLMSLLQLALSRAREFDADRGAVALTGDPAGIASALLKLERSTGRYWEEILFPGRRIPEPSLLRTHPRTEDRIARLRDLAQQRPVVSDPGPYLPVNVRPVHRPARWHRTGVWY